MNTSGPQETVKRGGRHAFLLPVVAGVSICLSAAYGADSDFIVEQDVPAPSGGQLSPKGEKQAQALAHFVNGLFEEESDGPEKALESYRKVLQLDPAYSDLAIKVSYDYLRRGETAEAISVLKDTIKAAPKDYAPSLALATIYLRHLQKPELAVKYAQSALAASPQNFAPYEALWEIYQSQKLSTKSEDLLDKAAKAKSDDPQFWLGLAQLRARVLAASSNPSPEARARLEKALAKAAANTGDNAEVLTQIADLYLGINKLALAAPLYERALEISPTQAASSREKLAACYVNLGKLPEAATVLESMVHDNPLDVGAYDQLRQIHVKNGQLDKALGDAQQALTIEPHFPRRYLDVVDLLFELKRFGDAADQLGEARKKFPQTSVLTFYHGMALSSAKRHEEAMQTFEQALVEAGNNQPELLNSEFYFQYGAAAEQAGQYVKAAEMFKKSIDLDPPNAARAYNYLGYMWIDRNENLDEAEQLVKRALELEPDNGAFLDSLGWLYYRKGQYNEALAELMKASEALKEEPDAAIFEHIADTYQALGKSAEAVLFWQKAQKLDPTNKALIAKLDKAAEKVAQKPAPSTPQTPTR